MYRLYLLGQSIHVVRRTQVWEGKLDQILKGSGPGQGVAMVWRFGPVVPMDIGRHLHRSAQTRVRIVGAGKAPQLLFFRRNRKTYKTHVEEVIPVQSLGHQAVQVHMIEAQRTGNAIRFRAIHGQQQPLTRIHAVLLRVDCHRSRAGVQRPGPERVANK